MGKRPGYEYHYRFSTDEQMICDEIIEPNRSVLSEGQNVCLFEIRTNFLLRRRKDDVVADESLGSERYDIEFLEDRPESRKYLITYRLEKAYWMPPDDIRDLFSAALDFAKQQSSKNSSAAGGGLVIPVAVHLDVCTVQQENEAIDAAIDRAIWEGSLVPVNLWPMFSWKRRHQLDIGFKLKDFLRRLVHESVRVEDEDHDVNYGLGIMEMCGICLRKNAVGAQVSLLKPCGHAFHSHCIVRWLMKSDSCPMCRSRAHDCPIRKPIKLN